MVLPDTPARSRKNNAQKKIKRGVEKGKTKKPKQDKSPSWSKLNITKVKPLHQLYQIVPWASRRDWNRVAANFADDDYEAVIQEILIWKERVPALPVGVEATLFLFQALIYDEPSKSREHLSYGSEEQARSLYSLAVIRYLNHVSHLATKEMGKSSALPMFKLASHVSVPEWIVNLRHEAAHGISLPSIETLRLAAAFIKSWLKENYWLPSDSPSESNILSAQPSTENDDGDGVYRKACETISAYVACRVYCARHCVTITDPDITRHLPNQPFKVKTKIAAGELKIKILNLLSTAPFLTACAIAQEMIPQREFYAEFSALFRNNPFGELTSAWNPLLAALEKKGKIILISAQLAEIHVDKNSAENVQQMSAQWLDHILKRIEGKDQDFSEKLNTRLLPLVMTAPNPHTKLFLPRLLHFVEPKLGPNVVRKLEALASIWMEPDVSFLKPASGSKMVRNSRLFTVEDIVNPERELGTGPVVSENSGLAKIDQQRFWSSIPFGTFLSGNMELGNRMEI